MKIYKVEKGNIYEGAYQSLYYVKLEDAEAKAEEIIKERLDYVIETKKRMGEEFCHYIKPYKWQKRYNWLAEQDYLVIEVIEVNESR